MSKPITIHDVTYPSMSAAARALGVTKQAVQCWVKRTLEGRATRLEGPGRSRGKGYERRLVDLDGFEMTVAEHADRLGITIHAARMRVVRKHGAGVKEIGRLPA